MGCDIHCHIEVKINGQWHHWSAPEIQRNYSLFARMAGVRAYALTAATPIAEPRGFVTDPTIITEIHWDHGGDGDWHTPSWFTGAEIDRLIEERRAEAEREIDEAVANNTEVTADMRTRAYRNPWNAYDRGGLGYLFDRDKFDVKASPGDYPDGVEDCRLVFWFDN